MSEEQDVRAAGWVDRADGRDGRPAGTGATAVVPGQRTEGEPPVADTAPAAPGEPTAGAEAAPRPGAPQPAGQQEPGVGTGPVAGARPAPSSPGAPEPPAEPGGTPYPTTPVGIRPRPRLPRRDPLTRMGPWAPVAGAAVGLLLGVVVVLFLAPAVVTFEQRLALVFVVLGLALLGAGGTLLADEVRLLRRGAEVRTANVGVIAGLLNGLTPARLLITASAFVLLLSAYVTGGR